MTSTTFEARHRIRFSECDPAGIVFYPQYFVLFNDLVEAWIDSSVPNGYHGLIATRRVGMPTVHLVADFKVISRMGDDVVLALEVVRVGTKSYTLALSCKGVVGDVRMTVEQTIVTTSLQTHAAIPIPDELRRVLIPQS
jgi:4-hydroxybenzoyl-CoA thioesterase